MIRTKLFLAGALALMVTFTGTSAYSQEPANQLTYFTFSAPFELPGGHVLPAGKYVFRIADSPSNRHIVHVLSEDQQTMHATLLAIPAQRQDPAPEPEVRFMETAANTPPAIRTWWYPGRTIGHEFIYPREHARRLAARQSEGVLTVAGDAATSEAMQTASLARINASGEESAWSAETARAENTTMTGQAGSQSATTTQSTTQSTTAQTTTAQTTTATTMPSQPSESTSATGTPTTTGTTSATGTMNTNANANTGTANNNTNTAMGRTEAQTAGTTNTAGARTGDTDMNTGRTALPQTASALPLIGLLGLASLVGAGLLRRFRR
jgi:LPXTG-motif cell wall-anchored protein